MLLVGMGRDHGEGDDAARRLGRELLPTAIVQIDPGIAILVDTPQASTCTLLCHAAAIPPATAALGFKEGAAIDASVITAVGRSAEPDAWALSELAAATAAGGSCAGELASLDLAVFVPFCEEGGPIEGLETGIVLFLPFRLTIRRRKAV
jgi:hypothetical protein